MASLVTTSAINDDRIFISGDYAYLSNMQFNFYSDNSFSFYFSCNMSGSQYIRRITIRVEDNDGTYRLMYEFDLYYQNTSSFTYSGGSPSSMSSYFYYDYNVLSGNVEIDIETSSGSNGIDLSFTKPQDEQATITMKRSNGSAVSSIPYQETGLYFSVVRTVSASNGGRSISKYKISAGSNVLNYLSLTSGTQIINSSNYYTSSQIQSPRYKNNLNSSSSNTLITIYIYGYDSNNNQISSKSQSFTLIGPERSPSINISFSNNTFYKGIEANITSTTSRTYASGTNASSTELNYFTIEKYNPSSFSFDTYITMTAITTTIARSQYQRYSSYYFNNGTVWKILNNSPEDATVTYVVKFYNTSSSSTVLLTKYFDFVYSHLPIALSSVYTEFFNNNPKQLNIGNTSVKGVFAGNKQVWPQINTVVLSNPTCSTQSINYIDVQIKYSFYDSQGYHLKTDPTTSLPQSITIYYETSWETGTTYGGSTWETDIDHETWPAGTSSFIIQDSNFNRLTGLNSDGNLNVFIGQYNFYISGGNTGLTSVKIGQWKFNLYDKDNKSINVGSTKIYCKPNAFSITVCTYQPYSGSSSYSTYTFPSQNNGTNIYGYFLNNYFYVRDDDNLPAIPDNYTYVSDITTTTNLNRQKCLGYYPAGYLTNTTESSLSETLKQYYANLCSNDTSKLNLFNYGVIKPQLTTYRYEFGTNCSWYTDKGATYEWDYDNSKLEVTVTPSGSNYQTDFRIFQPIFIPNESSKSVYMRYTGEDFWGSQSTSNQIAPCGIDATATWSLTEFEVVNQMNYVNMNKSTNTNLGSSSFTLTIKLNESNSWYYNYYDVQTFYYLKTNMVKSWGKFNDETNSSAKYYFKNLSKPYGTSTSDYKKYKVYLPALSGFNTGAWTAKIIYLGIFTLKPKTASATRTYLKR